MTPNTDYIVDIVDLPELRKFVMTFDFSDIADRANKFIVIGLIPNNQILNPNGNPLGNYNWVFPVDRIGDIVTGASIVSPLIAAAALPVVAPVIVPPIVAPVNV